MKDCWLILGRYAFIYSSAIVEYEVSNPPCDMYTLPDILRHGGYSLMLMKNSPYTEAMNIAIVKLRNNGFIDLLKIKWLSEMCYQEDTGGYFCIVDCI